MCPFDYCLDLSLCLSPRLSPTIHNFKLFPSKRTFLQRMKWCSCCSFKDFVFSYILFFQLTTNMEWNTISFLNHIQFNRFVWVEWILPNSKGRKSRFLCQVLCSFLLLSFSKSIWKILSEEFTIICCLWRTGIVWDEFEELIKIAWRYHISMATTRSTYSSGVGPSRSRKKFIKISKFDSNCQYELI